MTKEIDPVMKQTVLEDYGKYLGVIKEMETGGVDLEQGIEVLENLLQDIIDDMFIMDQEAHDAFLAQKADLGRKNKEKKENLLALIREPEDEIDSRNQKRLLLKYDFDKHRRLLAAIKGFSNHRGWFR